MALNAETKELKQAVENLTAGREEGVKRAVDAAMIILAGRDGVES
jgi:hypothetical protein